MALEELAVRKACENITAQQLADLSRAARRFTECVKHDDLLASAQADVDFHEVISSATGNRRLIQILGNLREQIYRYRLENLKDRRAYPALIRQHAEILSALEARDEERAANAIREHIEDQRRSILKTMKNSGEKQR